MIYCVCMLASHPGLLHRSLRALPVDHTEGDALGFGGERPGDRGTRTAHGDGDGAVTAGLDEEFPGTVAKLRNVVDAERDSHPAMRTNAVKEWCDSYEVTHALRKEKVKTYVTSPDLRRLISES